MSTQTYRPTSDSSVTLTQFGSGTGNYGRVNEVSEDVTNGVYNFTTLAKIDLYGFSMSNLGTLNSITVYAQCACDTYDAGTPTVRLVNHNGSTNYFSGSNTLTTSDTLYSYSFTTNLAWTNTLGIELAGANSGKLSANVYGYQVWIVVSYTAAGWTHIAKWNGVATSTIKTINGVVVANIKSINGVAV
jgi:hypothetical protein